MAQESLLTDEVMAIVGIEVIGPPVLIEMKVIRDYAIAINWPDPPDPLYVDEDYAKRTRYSGIIAPWSFYTNIDHSWIDLQLPLIGSMGNINGGCDCQHFQPIRPGDVITTTSKIVDISERESRSGKLIFTVTQRTLNNQRGEVVGICYNTVIRQY